jgi:hypothetical protein
LLGDLLEVAEFFGLDTLDPSKIVVSGSLGQADSQISRVVRWTDPPLSETAIIETLLIYQVSKRARSSSCSGASSSKRRWRR